MQLLYVRFSSPTCWWMMIQPAATFFSSAYLCTSGHGYQSLTKDEVNHRLSKPTWAQRRLEASKMLSGLSNAGGWMRTLENETNSLSGSPASNKLWFGSSLKSCYHGHAFDLVVERRPRFCLLSLISWVKGFSDQPTSNYWGFSEDGSRLIEDKSTISLLATHQGCTWIISDVMTCDNWFIQRRFERPRGGINTIMEVVSVSRSAFQSGLDGLLGSTEGSVTDSVYVDLLVVYRTVDAWWWLLTVP